MCCVGRRKSLRCSANARPWCDPTNPLTFAPPNSRALPHSTVPYSRSAIGGQVSVLCLLLFLAVVLDWYLGAMRCNNDHIVPTSKSHPLLCKLRHAYPAVGLQ